MQQLGLGPVNVKLTFWSPYKCLLNEDDIVLIMKLHNPLVVDSRGPRHTGGEIEKPCISSILSAIKQLTFI